MISDGSLKEDQKKAGSGSCTGSTFIGSGDKGLEGEYD